MTYHDIIYTDDVVTFFIEHFDNKILFHCTVNKWSKSAYIHILNVWVSILTLMPSEVYAPVQNSKIGKFALMLGFDYTDEYVLYSDGYVRRLMKCHKPPLQ